MSNIEGMNFEQIMKALEEKAKEVESTQLDLDKSVKAYEEGMKLIKLANSKLDESEKKIVELRKGIDGEYKEEELV